jgi:hypothetical protein
MFTNAEFHTLLLHPKRRCGSEFIDYDRFAAVLGVIMAKSEGVVALHTYSRYEFRYEYESNELGWPICAQKTP